ncbi:hypothetical protein [Haloarcula sp. JP-L23]|uniref:hypothetical protein n=1 Tax=Haloarcula sp. JP-L23 TaxID=2716717 RepID=UPI00140F20C7|nr:hypothetical protein G9465_25075 [Haloarcula sp. JP-L23]
MTYLRYRTVILSICCSLVVFSIAGCMGGTGVSNSEAKERALDAEEQHITEQFENASCVESWSPTSFVGLEKGATVTNRTTEGVYVEVTHPYSYSTKKEEADVESTARYLITPDDVQRIHGTDVSPC